MTARVLSILCILILTPFAFSQESPQTLRTQMPEPPAQGPSEAGRERPWSLSAHTTADVPSISIESVSNKNKYRIQPNTPSQSGVQIGYKGFSISSSFLTTHVVSDRNQDRYGTSDGQQLGIQFYRKNWGATGLYHRYKGLYAQPYDSSDGVAHRLPDSDLRSTAVQVTYVFSRGVFSPGFNLAAFSDQSQRQTKSGGSLLTQVYYFHDDFNRGETVDTDATATSSATLNNYRGSRLDAYGVALGIGYLWVTQSGWFAGFMGTYGGGPQKEVIDATPKNAEQNTLHAKASIAASAGYNAEVFFGGLRATSDSLSSSSGNNEWRSGSGVTSVTLQFGARF